MEVTKEEIKNMVREALTEMRDVNESDLVARKGEKSWADQKSEFKDNIDNLLKHIEDDKYEDAEGVITKTVKILNAWKKRIKEGSSGDVLDEH